MKLTCVDCFEAIQNCLDYKHSCPFFLPSTDYVNNCMSLESLSLVPRGSIYDVGRQHREVLNSASAG